MMEYVKWIMAWLLIYPLAINHALMTNELLTNELVTNEPKDHAP